MDRSNFNFVGSTYDFEKRLAYKAKLADKIEFPQPKELPPTDNTFNGVSPGGTLVHPSLGEGLLVEVDHGNNEVLIDFGTKGLIGLVLSQAKSFVHSPIKEITKGIAGKDDAFIGSEIQSRALAPQDRDFREVDLSRIISPDFIVPEKKFFPKGSLVWHPDLGSCTVLNIDEKTNRLTLKTTANAEIDMVLSQVRSKLRAIETTPEHVPLKPLIREPLAKQVPQYTSRSDVSVSIPEVFKTWQRQQQFMFLTRTQKLTTEQANDVFSVLDGKKPLFHSVNIVRPSEEELEVYNIPGLDANPPEVQATKPNILENKRLWHPDFGECSVSSADVENNELILLTSVGLMPFVMDVTLPKMAVLTAAAPEHAPKQLGTRVLVTSDTPIANRPSIHVSIPEVFVTWRTLEQYQYLTTSLHLSPNDANNIIDVMTGKLHTSSTEYEIQWTNEPPEANKRSEFKDQLLDKVEKASIEPVVPIAPAPVDSGIHRVIEEVAVVKKETILKVSVILPEDFKNWTSSGQYVFLTRSRQLTFNEANDVMDTLQGKPLKSNSQYEVIWSDVEPVAYAAIDSGVRRATEEIEVVEKEPILQKVVVTLPTDFKNWSESKQYSFLTRARQLTINESNEVLNTFQGKPVNSKIQYEIVWSE